MVEKEKKKRLKRDIKLSDFVYLIKGLKIIADDDKPLVGSLEIHTSEGATGDVILHKKIK